MRQDMDIVWSEGGMGSELGKSGRDKSLTLA